MMLFAKSTLQWFNRVMKNDISSISDNIISRNEDTQNQTKSTNINILLNRIQVNEKNESRKKLYFSAAASAGLVLFGLFIF
jgi:hypothetical protein